MNINDYQLKLDAAQDRLDKAINLKAKYESKIDSLYKDLCDKGFDPKDNYIAALRAFNTSQEIWDLHWKYTQARDAAADSERKIKELTQIRDNWKTKLELEKAKSSELQNVPAVVKEFVHNWRLKVFDYYIKQMNEYSKAKQEVRDLYNNYYDHRYETDHEELYKKYNEEYRKLKEKFQDPIILHYALSSNREEELNKILDKEEKEKILDLIRRVTKITGEITDASQLSIGSQNGELNGIIVGENGKCYVETIGAGGYNIQKFHYRVLTKPIK